MGASASKDVLQEPRVSELDISQSLSPNQLIRVRLLNVIPNSLLNYY